MSHRALTCLRVIRITLILGFVIVRPALAQMITKWGLLPTRDGSGLEYRISSPAHADPRLPAILHFSGSGFSTLVHTLLEPLYGRMTDLGFTVISVNKRGIRRNPTDLTKEVRDDVVYGRSGLHQLLADSEYTQAMRKAKSSNPLILLDEIDKLGADFRGDPASALLEVLDPEQNTTFNDHYLEVDYDLSDVMFITTANTLRMPQPLLDRMEIIRLAGYTEDEKVEIAKQHLIEKQIKANGLTDKNISFSDNAILTIIRRYTKEAGVRNLEREIASVCRKVAKEVVKGGSETSARIGSKVVSKYLGVYKYRYGEMEKKDEVGITTGMAWTEVGGELLTIEVTTMPLYFYAFTIGVIGS